MAADRGPLGTWRWLGVFFIVAGGILGVATMLGLLHYDGGRRINVTLIAGVAALELLLAVLTTLESLIGWQPWRNVFESVSRRWPPPAQGQADSVLRALRVPLSAIVAQNGGLAFGVAALVVLLAEVVFHDLAFGWSTTLQASAPGYHALATALAWPWRPWLPQAVPSLELVEHSRYFRSGSPVASDPALLGLWWRFIAMLWLFYVVVPRVLLLAMAKAMLALKIRRLLTTHPGVVALRERCASPWIERGADTASDAITVDGSATIAPTPTPAAPGNAFVRWADAGDPQQLGRCLGGGTVGLDAGGSADFRHDDETLRRMRTIAGPLIVFTRGWEPPTGELADFLERVHAIKGSDLIQVVPLALGDAPLVIDGPARAQWQRFIDRMHETRIILADVPAGATPT